MNTHEIARTLILLARVLRRGPNVSLEEFSKGDSRQKKPNPSNIPLALSALVSLSKFDKAQWKAVIKEYDFPIQVLTTESTRDIVGKILRHLEQDAEARERLRIRAQRSRSDISPKLMNALNFLMK